MSIAFRSICAKHADQGNLVMIAEFDHDGMRCRIFCPEGFESEKIPLHIRWGDGVITMIHVNVGENYGDIAVRARKYVDCGGERCA